VTANSSKASISVAYFNAESYYFLLNLILLIWCIYCKNILAKSSEFISVPKALDLSKNPYIDWYTWFTSEGSPSKFLKRSLIVSKVESLSFLVDDAPFLKDTPSELVEVVVSPPRGVGV